MTSTCEIDRVIGAKVCETRTKAGLSRAALAISLDLSEGQLIAMEEGRKRIGAGTLLKICRKFGLRPQHFFKTWIETRDMGAIARTSQVAAE